MLDNTAGGGLPAGLIPLEGMYKEGQEEAGYNRKLLEENMVAPTDNILRYFLRYV